MSSDGFQKINVWVLLEYTWSAVWRPSGHYNTIVLLLQCFPEWHHINRTTNFDWPTNELYNSNPTSPYYVFFWHNVTIKPGYHGAWYILSDIGLKICGNSGFTLTVLTRGRKCIDIDGAIRLHMLGLKSFLEREQRHGVWWRHCPWHDNTRLHVARVISPFLQQDN